MASTAVYSTVLLYSSLNQFIENSHFQMEHLSAIKTLLKSGHFVTKLDLKDAYLSVTVHPESQTFLRFIWKTNISASPLRFEYTPSHIHTVVKTSGSLSEEKRSSPSNLPRQHPPDRILSGRDTQVYQDSDVSSRVLRVNHQQGEIDPQSNSGTDLFGVHHKLIHHDSNLTSRQSEQCALTVLSDACSNLEHARVVSASHMAS